MLVPVLAAAILLPANPEPCAGTLRGTWLLTWEQVLPDGRFHDFSALASAEPTEGPGDPDLALFVAETITPSAETQATIHALETCSQRLQDGAVEVSCEIRDLRGGFYIPDNFKIVCNATGPVSAILNQNGSAAAMTLDMRRVGHAPQ